MALSAASSPLGLLAAVAAVLSVSCAHGAAHRSGEQGGGGPSRCDTCPYFLNTSTLVTTSQSIPTNLTCGVRNLGDRKVSWIRRRDLHVLTTGTFTYTTDSRFRALHLPGSPYWSLEVGDPGVSDSGVYECQVSTQPKIFRRFTLTVVVPSAEITGTQQMFMKAGSDINITCVVKDNIRGASINWYHTLPHARNSVQVEEISTAGRGGVQLVTDKHAGTSWLLVTHATWRDAGNYSCVPAHGRPTTVSIHVLDDESITGSGVIVAEEVPAAMQHDLHPSAASSRTPPPPPLPYLHLLYPLLAHALLCLTGGGGGVGGARAWLRCWCLAWGLLVALLLLPGLAPPAAWRPGAALRGGVLGVGLSAPLT
ncbi:uncharacterized protein LOC119575598 isoform X1 [Penaeus monodon]|uniref:uncharacterized protein LOC119575598 isoform X1 n=1 Tax=Penaeus monodon TaxID=6687 RepID=UPI0018A794F0|nr:uncharacterized protein LOC119575598 isoform X1 [Penaeus monodon]XP_037779181.1 uncharacterized protein LOC119575598 isoform X1 [Penaeus monodon]XP_037779186.1 uncharacterized protein LOC119575598 isoform X1 [Penaeus monodon]